LSVADLEAYEFSIEFFSGKGLRTVVDTLVPSPMSSIGQISIKVFRSALLPVRTETLGHMYASILA
jgi:hypothetical protein